MKEIGIYIHIPFCIQKCAYCDFHSYSHMEHKIKFYVDALIKEMKQWADQFEDYKIKTIFIGGGTPSILPIEEMEKILNVLHACFKCMPNIEFTIESNPGTLEKEKIRYYLESGINRLSIGLQAWQDPLLKILGRIHTREQFLKNYFIARDTGFKNINIDLMFGLPDQTLEQWDETLKEVIHLKPDHLSTYSLKLEEGTPLNKLYKTGHLNLPSEEEERNMYYLTINQLLDFGYNHYEISNFSKKGRECIHNNIYWENQEYIGFGLGAHSYIDKIRFSNTTHLEEYIHKMNKNENIRILEEKTSLKDEIEETMFLGLRRMKGINISNFMSRFGISPMQLYANEIEELERNGLLQIDDQSIRLTSKGIDLSNQVFIQFLFD